MDALKVVGGGKVPFLRCCLGFSIIWNVTNLSDVEQNLVSNLCKSDALWKLVSARRETSFMFSWSVYAGCTI